MPVVWVAASRGIRRLGRSFGTSIETRLNSRVTLPAGLRRGSQFCRGVRGGRPSLARPWKHLAKFRTRAGLPRYRTASQASPPFSTRSRNGPGHAALSASGKVAVATFVMHQRQHLCAVSPSDSSLTLLTLRFPDEIVPLSEKQAPSARVTATELSMAKQLVQHMSGKFVPSHFKDTYRSDLRRRVQEKIRKKEQHSLDVEPPSAERTKAEVIDLMAALKASLGKNKARPRSHSTHRDSRRKRA